MRVKNKFAYILLIILIVSSICIICIKLSYNKKQDLYVEAISKFQQISNYSYEQRLNISYDKKANQKDFEKIIEGKVDEKKLEYYNNDGITEIYGKVIDGKNYVFTKNNKNWIAVKSDDSMFSLKGLAKLLSDFKNYKVVSSDIKSKTKYKLVADNKILKKYISKNIMKTINQINMQNSENDLIIYIYVNKDKNIDKIVFDLNKYIEKDNKLFKNIKISLDIKDIDKITNILPEDLDYKKIDFEQLNQSSEPYTEEKIMYDIILSATVYCKEGTIDFKQYNNQLNKYLQLNEYDVKTIQSGIIKIDKDCNVEVTKDFVINNKICTFDNENYESCK